MARDERPLRDVPRWLWGGLVVSLALQVALQSGREAPAQAAEDLPPPPSVAALRVASLGEPEALSRLTMLYLQAFDLGGGNRLPYSQLDYRLLERWLDVILQLDPRSDYPLFSAARVYAEAPDPQRSRIMVNFVYKEYLRDPQRRWPALAHATLLAKHRLHDLPLARRLAAELARHATRDMPLWARQMEVFILEDMNEFEAAAIMLGGLLESGAVSDPAEARFLRLHLQQLKAKAEAAKR